MDKRKNRLRESTDAGAGAEMRQADRVHGAQAGGADGLQAGYADALEAEAIGEAETWKEQLKKLARQNKLAVFSAVLIGVILLIAVFAPITAPYDPYAQDLVNRLAAPSAQHWLGTDDLGRDMVSRIIYGARISMAIGLLPTMISMVIGTILGLIAGYYGGKVDFVIMRLADVMLAFPSLLLAMVIMYTMGGGLVNIFIALSLVNWAGTARIVRSQTLSLKEAEIGRAHV